MMYQESKFAGEYQRSSDSESESDVVEVFQLTKLIRDIIRRRLASERSNLLVTLVNHLKSTRRSLLRYLKDHIEGRDDMMERAALRWIHRHVLKIFPSLSREKCKQRIFGHLGFLHAYFNFSDPVHNWTILGASIIIISIVIATNGEFKPYDGGQRPQILSTRV